MLAALSLLSWKSLWGTVFSCRTKQCEENQVIIRRKIKSYEIPSYALSALSDARGWGEGVTESNPNMLNTLLSKKRVPETIELLRKTKTTFFSFF
jgi:hypothetical protein